MASPSRPGFVAAAALAFSCPFVPGLAAAAPAAPVGGDGGARVLALFAPVDGAAADAAGRQAFTAAVTATLGNDPTVVVLPGPERPVAADKLRAGAAALDRLATDEAIRALDAAATAASLEGGRGLSHDQLADIFLLRAVVTLRGGSATEARAWEDLVRAATLARERVLDPARFPPTLLEMWARATAEVSRRPVGTLVVKGPPGSRVIVDARDPAPAPAVFPALPQGEHYVRIEEAGRLPWATTAVVSEPTVVVEPPVRAALVLDDGAAAQQARAAGAGFALVAQLRIGQPEALMDLRLVAADGKRRSSVLVPLTPAPTAPAAVRHAVEELVAQARGAHRLAMPSAVTQPSPPSWYSRWPVLVGAAAVVAGGVALTWALTRDDGSQSGFSATADPGSLGR